MMIYCPLKIRNFRILHLFLLITHSYEPWYILLAYYIQRPSFIVRIIDTTYEWNHERSAQNAAAAARHPSQ